MPLGTLVLTLITLIIGGAASIPLLFDPEGDARDDSAETVHTGLWNLRAPVKNRWFVPKPFPTPRPVMINKKPVEQIRANPALWDDASRMVQSAITKVMDEIDFGLQLTERDHEVEDVLEQVRHLTNLVADFYSEMRRQEGATNLMSIWKGTGPPATIRTTLRGGSDDVAAAVDEGKGMPPNNERGVTSVGGSAVLDPTTFDAALSQHFVLPATKTSTEVPEIYYEIFKAYKDRRTWQQA